MLRLSPALRAVIKFEICTKKLVLDVILYVRRRTLVFRHERILIN